LQSLRDLPAETRDGVRIVMLANIEFPHETPACLDRGADGIGLYRTEFLYVGPKTEPTEEDHFRAYSRSRPGHGGPSGRHPYLGSGRRQDGFDPVDADEDPNPFLGLRSIRLALSNLQLFRPQLRAILRASALGDVRVMFP
jgi:phosphoenolpyruvate-protein phosphotransferase (PTS system enzyme I)